MRGVMVNALVTLLALLLSMGASRGEKNWVSYKDGTIEWLCQKIEGTETCKIKPEPARKELRIKGKVKIPSEVTIDGKTLKVVTVAKNAFSGCEKLSEVFIPEGVDIIEERAFYSCAELSTLQLPQCLKVIGEQSFSRCGKLESVNIPVNVESIGYDAFQYCSKLEKFEVAAENKHLSAVDGVLFNKDKTALLRYIIGPGGDSYTIPTTVKSIGARAFIMGEGRLKTVNISANVESIGYDAFQDCNELEKFEVAAGNGHFSEAGGVLFNKDKTALLCYPRGLSADSYDIPEKVKSIGACAFYGNGKLQTVNIPAGVTAIGKHAFEECSVLERVVVPKGVSTIEPNTFYFCDNLKSVELPERLKTIGEEAFSTCESLEIVVLPEGLTSIGKSAFAFSPKFSEVTIPTSVTEIGEGAFSGTPLTSVVIPAGVKKLNGTFSGCIFLEKVTLPEGLEVLEGTFSACEKLTEITIPASVISIEDWTFYGSISLNRVYYLAEADAAVTENAFDGIADPATLFVRKGEKVKIEGNGKAWKAKFKVIEERNVVTFDADGGLPTPAAQWLKDDNKGAEKPAKDPVKEGFRFKGWTLLISGEDYHFDTKVEGNIALKAKYIAEYTLTITAGANGSVKVTRDNAQGEELTSENKLHEGDKLFIAATPAVGYELGTLTVNGNDQANSSVFTVAKENVEVKATFKKKSGTTPPAVAEYTLTITAGTNGSVKVTRDNAQGEELTSETKLHEGDKLFIAATPAAGYELGTLTVNGNDHANSSVFTVAKENVEVKATFKKKGGTTPPAVAEYTLTITSGANGSVKVTRDNAQGEELTSETKLHEGDMLFIAATPAAGYELGTLTVNGNDQANSSVFTVGKANVEVKATFKKKGGTTPPAVAEYTLTITAGTNGSVKVTRDNAQGEELTSETKLHEGDKLFIAATPAAGYELGTLTVNGNDQANSSVFTVAKENVEVKATFKKKGGTTPPAVAEYTLTITSGANGSVKVTRDNAQGEELTSETKLHEGDKLFIAATPAADYELETLTVNGNNQANSSVFTVGKANVEVKATFKKKGGATPPAVAEYTLTITAGANGSVKVTRDNAQGDALTDGAKLKEGDKLFIAATPAADYELETLTVNGNNQANSSVFTVGKANVEVKATFKAQGGTTPPAVAEYTLTITSGANGSVKVTRDNAQGEELTSETKLHEGDMLFIAATPAAGYELETLTVNGNDHANSSVFTVAKENVEVKATFKKKGGVTPPSAVESVLLAAARVVQNPIDNALVLEGVSTAERIEVYSLTGVQTYACAPRGEERVEIATESWASGTYVVRIIAADGEKTVKVVKR